MTPAAALDARIAAVRDYVAAVEAWQAATEPEKRADRLRTMHDAMRLEGKTRIALDDAIAEAARERS